MKNISWTPLLVRESHDDSDQLGRNPQYGTGSVQFTVQPMQRFGTKKSRSTRSSHEGFCSPYLLLAFDASVCRSATVRNVTRQLTRIPKSMESLR